MRGWAHSVGAVAAVMALAGGCSVGSDAGFGAGPSLGTTAGGATDGDSDSDAASASGASDGAGSTGRPEDPADEPSSGGSTGEPWVPDPDGPAYLHADLWSVFYNDRTRCGAEYAFAHLCHARGDDCSLYDAAVSACDPNMIVYGQVGPEKQGEDLCSRGRFPDIGGCDATAFDFDALRYWWYGANWAGNWPFATLKVFEAGADYTGGGELIAYSSLPGRRQAAMDGIENHGLGSGCAMLGETSGDEAYQTPFGAFAWIEVPTDRRVTVVAASSNNFADEPFQGCSRGSATQDPWVTDAPGASAYGCVYVEEVEFEPGHHYVWRNGRIEELDQPRPPQDIIDAFAWPEVGVDVQTPTACSG